MKTVYLIVAKGLDGREDFSDPFGGRYGPGASLQKGYIACNVIGNDNDILTLEYNGAVRSGVVEGTSFGTYTNISKDFNGLLLESGITNRILRQIYETLSPLTTDPDIGNNISDFIALFNPNNRLQKINALVNTITDTLETAQARRNALTLLTYLLILEAR